MKTGIMLKGHEYEIFFKDYMKQYNDHLISIQQHDSTKTNEEEQNVRVHFAGHPELYGGADRNSRTDAQWQKRIEYLAQKKDLITSLDRLTKKVSSIYSPASSIDELTTNFSPELIQRLANLEKTYNEVIATNIQLGLPLEQATDVSKSLFLKHLPVSKILSDSKEEFDHKLDYLSKSNQAIQNLLEDCIAKYQTGYSLPKEQALAQIQKEFAAHSTSSSIEHNAESKLVWLANHKKSLEEESRVKNEFAEIAQEIKADKKLISTAGEVLGYDLRDDSNKEFLKSATQRMAIFEEYRDRLVELRDNYIHNTNIPKIPEKFTPSTEKSGGKKSIPPHVSIEATYRSPSILIYHKEIELPAGKRTKGISFDQRTMNAQAEALALLKKPQEDKKRKADEASLPNAASKKSTHSRDEASLPNAASKKSTHSRDEASLPNAASKSSKKPTHSR